nr:hypothetical protein B0A51_17215 [Rachicladosporium sp. CCFEE 5018]
MYSTGPRSTVRSGSSIGKRTPSIPSGSRIVRGVLVNPEVLVRVDSFTNNWDNENEPTVTNQWSPEPTEQWDIGATYRPAADRAWKIDDYEQTTPFPAIPEEQWLDLQKKVIKDTRLNDDLTDQPEVWVKLHVPYDNLIDLLDLALRKAQEIIYHSAVLSLPASARQAFIRGPRSIVLGRSELSRVFGGSFGQENDLATDLTHYNNLGGAPPEEINYAINAIIDIRNMQAHQLDLNNVKIDNALKTIQSLAITLRDEKRTLDLREERDKLAILLKSTLAGINDRHKDSLAVSPESGAKGKAATFVKWEVHHQMTFRQILEDELYQEAQGLEPNHKAYPEVVVLAAKKWDTDPEILARTVPRF